MPESAAAEIRAPVDVIVEAIAAQGFAIVREFLAPRDIAALRARSARLDAANLLAPAAIGRAAGRAQRADVRGDRIRWLDALAPAPAERPLFAALDALRACANRELQLGLFEHEVHYATYPPGSGYARHVDRFRDDDARVLSFALYLNDGWAAEDGGALALHADGRSVVEVLPEAGTFVAFLADRFPHEVRPARRERRSLAGWFRRRMIEAHSGVGNRQC